MHLQISIPGKHNVQYVLKHCRDLMAGEVLKHKNKPEEAIFKKYHDNFSHMLSKYRSTPSTKIIIYQYIFVTDETME